VNSVWIALHEEAAAGNPVGAAPREPQVEKGSSTSQTQQDWAVRQPNIASKSKEVAKIEY
jgi:hypothetical protein